VRKPPETARLGGCTDTTVGGRKPIRLERTDVMLAMIWDHLWFFVVAAPLVLIGLAVVASSVRIVGANESGLVVKRFGPALASGRIVALNGEAGYQARMLAPGWHFFLWRVRYRVIKVPTVVVRPGEIALVVAADGAAMPSERVLGKAVACNNFQDAEAFLGNGGERGRQITLLTAGTSPGHPAPCGVGTTGFAPQNRR